MRNYEMIHLIQAAGLPENAQDVVVRAFNKMNDMGDSSGCLCISVSLCIALEHLGYDPTLCVGKVRVGEHDMYHAWTELDGKVIDVAIFGNSSFSPLWLDEVVKPQVYRDYGETDVRYEPFAFDEDFKYAMISAAMGRSFFFYCDSVPTPNAIWNLIMYYLNSSSPSVLASIKEIAKKHIIGERSNADA